MPPFTNSIIFGNITIDKVANTILITNKAALNLTLLGFIRSKASLLMENKDKYFRISSKYKVFPLTVYFIFQIAPV